jgi:sporulation protein YlmC with PRC-barrel domain
MKRFAIPAISLAALMASGVAFAQTTPDQQPATQPSQEMQQKKEPATQAPTTAPDPSKSSDSQSSEQPKTDTTVQKPADSTTTTTTSATNLDVDAGKAVLATSFIGSTVYTAANENIGDINDMVFDDKGMIKAVIVGVGGFLGMGEKDVALPLEKIKITKDENNAVKLTVEASREELENAPAFDKTLFVVKAPVSGSPTTPTTTPSGGSSTTPQQ